MEDPMGSGRRRLSLIWERWASNGPSGSLPSCRCLGARRYPALFWAAVVNLAVHMAIPHKEYRFVLLTTGLLILLEAIGTGDVIAAAQRRWPSTPNATWVGAALSLWIVASAIFAFSGNIEGRWRPNAPMMEVMDDARRLPDLCGIGAYRIKFW
jgi:phosphatidylinositol glycan class B